MTSQTKEKPENQKENKMLFLIGTAIIIVGALLLYRVASLSHRPLKQYQLFQVLHRYKNVKTNCPVPYYSTLIIMIGIVLLFYVGVEPIATKVTS
ncbi:hypothetical protein [Paenisporosarcina sp. OV554]|uniref:hypothetical protein n=1 Tax=Paenisporosarcina sp. OV554 TaxID=2135694 RepID=UPI001304EF57|nr:hypothetical protein [Paenisporosarcina sp. OV554]